ncbi:hypothetical protein NQZ79_g8474 [Umbelopsis isabellina]|nr:hypothetical protein NQZ79_g8474 [Umbelopsis isabellina]
MIADSYRIFFFCFGGFPCIGQKNAVPATSAFYGACILSYTMPVLAVLWCGAGLYIARRALSVSISIIVPTAILCVIDVIAMRAGVWHINEQTSTEIFPFPDLPLEELAFFLLVNTVIVFACCAIDRANAIIQMFPYIASTDPDVQLAMQNPFSIPYLVALLKCFAYPDYCLPNQPIADLKVSLKVLSKASKSFNTASTAFSFNTRQDLGTLYGFCRMTDEIADSESDPHDRKRKMDTLIEFVNDLFSTKDYGLANVTPDFIDWTKYGHLPEEDLACYRAISRMVHFLPKKPFEELITGYQWDIDGQTVRNQDDLLNYCTFVASSVGDLCTAVIMYRTGQGNWRLEQNRSEWITHRAREMGQVLQLVNIARDIVTDSQTLGRCYVPVTYLTSPTQELELLKTGKARHIRDGNLRTYALRILALADKLSNSGSRGIDALPMEVRNGVRAACQVYSSIGIKIRTAQGYPLRAHLNTWERGWVALRCLYGLHGQSTSTRSRMDIWKIY